MRPLLLLTVIGMLPSLAAAPAIRVAGSDFLAGAVARSLVESGRQQDLEFSFQLEGTRPGVEAVISGGAEAGLFFFPPGEPLPLRRLFLWPLAHQVVVVLGHERSPLHAITVGQLAERLGRPVGGESADRRQQRGRRGSLAILADGAGPTLALFRRVALGGAVMNGEIVTVGTNQELLAAVARDESTLALGSGWPPEGAGVRVLAVATGPDQAAVLPTPENLEQGRYPFRLTLYVGFRRETAPAAAGLIRLLHTEAGTRILAQAGLVPLAAATRDRRILELEALLP